MYSKLISKDRLDFKNAKSHFVKFYKEAYFIGLIEDEEKELEVHFALDRQKEFDSYFPYLFCEKPKNTEAFLNITPNMSELIKDRDITMDFDKPNKWLTDFPNPITQLMYCCAKGDRESVKKLLDSGVDVDVLKRNDNASTLHFCINEFIPNYCEVTQEHIKIAKLLIPRMKKATLHSRLVKKKETILSRCIEHGIVELVELLIKHDIDLEAKTCTADNASSLYMCLECINRAKYGLFTNNTPRIMTADATDKEVRELIRMNPMTAHVIFEEDYKECFEVYKEIYNNEELKNRVESLMCDRYRKRKENYYKIFDMIADSIKHVDIVQENASNFTPLLYATKINETELVKKLIAKGANKYHKNADGKMPYDFAQAHYNLELMSLLR